MSVTAVWHHFMKQGEAMPEKSILDALSRVGVRSRSTDPSEPSGQGVLFFDQITQRLCHYLREASRRGLKRVLAIALSQSALALARAWQLLQAGASDVFAGTIQPIRRRKGRRG
jgi:hypothetical protein